MSLDGGGVVMVVVVVVVVAVVVVVIVQKDIVPKDRHFPKHERLPEIIVAGTFRIM